MTTADLDAIAERAHPRRRAARRRSSATRASFPATICASVNDEIVHGIPSRERVLEDRRRPVARLRRHLGGLPGRLRRHRDRGRRAAVARGRQAGPRDGGRAGGRDRRDPPRRAPLRHRRRHPAGRGGRRVRAGPRVRRARDRPGDARGPVHPELRLARARPRAEAGPGRRRGAHGDAGGPRDPGPGRRLDRGHGRRLARGPFRAHDRRDRGRPRGPHGAELRDVAGPPSRPFVDVRGDLHVY